MKEEEEEIEEELESSPILTDIREDNPDILT